MAKKRVVSAKSKKNLKPFKKGETSPHQYRGGRRVTLKTILTRLEESDFDWDLLPLNAAALARAKKTKLPWLVVVNTMLAKSTAGDVRAAEWLAKNAYGNTLDITSGGKPIKQNIIKLENFALSEEDEIELGLKDKKDEPKPKPRVRRAGR